VSVAIPHFYRETSSETGYGSVRAGTRLARQLALARCLSSVLALNRQSQDLILNHAQEELEITAPIRDSTTKLAGVVVDLHVFVNGDHYLDDVIDHFEGRLTLHRMNLEDPQRLPFNAARWLCHEQPSDSDLHLYFEDDLVIQDPRFVDKQVWFTERTQHRFVLMPHRIEPCVAQAPMRLCVDGPIKPVEQQEAVWSDQEQEFARGTFWDGRSVGFAVASNPHSGSFCLSEVQRQAMVQRQSEFAPTTFVGPLETAATGTVLDHFPVLKPLWPERDFLWLEHGHPSFLNQLKRMPLHKVASAAEPED